MTTTTGGGFLSFPIVTFQGLIFLFILFLNLGMGVGSMVGSIKDRDASFRIIKFFIPLFIIFSFGYFIYSANTSTSITRCEIVSDGYNIQNRSNCYIKYLSEHRELASTNYCDTYFQKPAGGKDYHSRCLKIVAQYTNNDKICDLIPENPGAEFDSFFEGENTIIKDECYQGILDTPAVSPELSRCGSWLSIDARDQCRTETAVLTNNSQVCELIESTSRKDQCYARIAEIALERIEKSLSDEANEDSSPQDATLEGRHDFKDGNLVLTDVLQYQIIKEEAYRRSRECANEVNVFNKKFVGKIFLCKYGSEYKGGLYLDDRKNVRPIFLEIKRIGEYDYRVYRDSKLPGFEYEAETDSGLVRAIYDNNYGSDISTEQGRLEFEKLLEKLVIK